MAFPPLGNSVHVVISACIVFPSNAKEDLPFYSRADWDGLRHHLRDVLWEVFFKLDASATCDFCEWV